MAAAHAILNPPPGPTLAETSTSPSYLFKPPGLLMVTPPGAGAGPALRTAPGVIAALATPAALPPGVTNLVVAAGPPMPDVVTGRLRPRMGAAALLTTGLAMLGPLR